MQISQSVPIALNDINHDKYPLLSVNGWDDVCNNPVLFRMSKLVGKYGVHIACAPDIMINLTGRELVEYLDNHVGQPSVEGNFANMLTGRSSIRKSI
ncbi:MAG: hypothetical protein AAB323_00225 [Pseudomonadota bacterium]